MTVWTDSNYVFRKGNGTVYIYNSAGTQAKIPEKRFVNFKKQVMKKIIIFSILTIITIKLMAQEAKNLYLESLKLHLAYLNDLREEKDSNIYFIEADYKITGDLPQTINGLTVRYLDREEIKSKGKQSQFHLISVRQLELKQDKIEINIIDFMVDYKKRKFNYSNTGGSKLVFKYDCEKALYILYEKKQGGI